MTRVYLNNLGGETAESIADKLADEFEKYSLVDLCFLGDGDFSLYKSGQQSLASNVARLLAQRGYYSLEVRFGREIVIYERKNISRIDSDDERLSIT